MGASRPERRPGHLAAGWPEAVTRLRKGHAKTAIKRRNRVPILDNWCIGFITALELDPEGWGPLVDTDTGAVARFLVPDRFPPVGWACTA